MDTSTNSQWTYSTYRAALRFDGKTVALLSPDGRNAFGNGQIQGLLNLLNSQPEGARKQVAESFKAKS